MSILRLENAQAVQLSFGLTKNIARRYIGNKRTIANVLAISQVSCEVLMETLPKVQTRLRSHQSPGERFGSLLGIST